MNRFVLPLSSPQATDPDRVGPKAANLATLSRAGLPTPGGFCLTAAAYRHQLATLGIGLGSERNRILQIENHRVRAALERLRHHAFLATRREQRDSDWLQRAFSL